ncbi:MAG: TonB-dependent receptor [Ignavibacteriae bacterium]|nr:MAG: TonB-dependent receptor [Ignavibacteriota bacterium]
MQTTILFVILLLIPVFLFAQDDTVETYNLDPITISATRAEAVRSMISPSLSVLSHETIQQNQQKSVFSLISQQVPGVFVLESGVLGFGINTPAGQISIRGVGGYPNTGILTLIDGRPQYMGLMGHPVADSYLSAHIERVEIIRGPASLLYGSNAMGGVINLITRSATLPGISGSVSLSYGSYNSQHLGANMGYEYGPSSTIVSFTHERTDGFRPWSEFNANSGYLKSSIQINEQCKATIDGSLTKFRTYDPGTIAAPLVNNWMDIQRGYVGASIDNDFGVSKGSFRFAYNFGHHELYTTWISGDFAAVASLHQTLSLFPDNTLTVGIDMNKVGGKGRDHSKDYGAPSVYAYAFYAFMQHTFFQKLALNGGLRYDNNELFGGIVIPQIGAAYKMTDETTVRTTVGKGFRSPTIRELFLFPAPTPTLQPENMWNYELGVAHTLFGRISLDMTGFVSEGKNIILPRGVWPNLALSNSGTFIHRGVEFSGSAFISHELHGQISYSFIDAGKETRSLPKHKMFLGCDYSCQSASLSLSIQHIAGMYGSDNSQNPLNDYTNIGAKVSVRAMAHCSIIFSVDNLLAQRYQTILGYPMPGRTVAAAVNWSLQ